MARNTEHAVGTIEQHHQPNQPNTSHLFLVRLWAESNDEGDAVWCGKVQHVTKGGADQFRDWPTLIDILLAMLPNVDKVRHPGIIEE